MKSWIKIILIAATFTGSWVQAQKLSRFRVSEHLQQGYQSYQWIINGVSIHPTNDLYKVPVHYPFFDTIIFSHELYKDEPDTILTRFRPGKTYKMVIGCCAEGFDVYDTVSLTKRHRMFDTIPDHRFDSLVMATWENGRVRFMIKNLPKGDTLIGIYSDLSGMPGGQLITSNSITDLVPPLKGYYSTNNDFIIIA